MRVAQFDKVAIGELTVSFLGAPGSLKAKAAFVNSRSGSTHGWTECTSWSKETLAKLAELKTCMEADLERVHFEGTPTVAGGSASIAHDGLGETLGGIPQG